MKAVLVYSPGGPEALEYVDVPTPAPGAGEVQIRAEAFGVGQPDVLIRRGVYKWMPPLPVNPGNDVAGRISAIGAGVRGFDIGQKVLLSARDLAQRGGCYAEYVTVPGDAVYPLDDRIDLGLAVCLAVLAPIDRRLHAAGTDKTKLLFAMVWMSIATSSNSMQRGVVG